MGSSTLSGRIFFQSGVVGYGTTREGDESISELDRLLDTYDGEAGAKTRAGLKEQLTEALYSLTRLESGTFEFVDGASSKFDVGTTFAVVELLRLVDERAAEWEKIRKVLPSNETRLTLASDLPVDRSEVMVDKESWSMLATVAGGASVSSVAGLREISEFEAAKSLAELVKWGLLSTSDEPASSQPVALDSESSSLEAELSALKAELSAPEAELPDSKTAPAAFAELEALKPPLELAEEPPLELTEEPPEELAEEPPLELTEELPEKLAGEPPEEEQVPEREPEKTPATPRVEPKVQPVSFSKKDLSDEERNELIRNIGRGIYPSD